jgi:hypothetical protein
MTEGAAPLVAPKCSLAPLPLPPPPIPTHNPRPGPCERSPAHEVLLRVAEHLELDRAVAEAVLGHDLDGAHLGGTGGYGVCVQDSACGAALGREGLGPAEAWGLGG